MPDILLVPPIAFVLYLVLVGLLSGMGRLLAGAMRSSTLKTSTYAGGEAPPAYPAAPGYTSFFIIALFFAILHLGALTLGSSGVSPVSVVYIVGLALILLALIVG